MLRAFYAHFRPKWEQLLEESATFAAQAGALNNEITGDRVDTYLDRISTFYGVEEDLAFTARFVWWPPIDRTFAYIKGRTFLMYRHPEQHADDDDWAGIIMHESVHYLSAHQPAEQKRALSERFLEICPAKADNTYHLLEEPLAVVWGQIAFATHVLNAPIDPSEELYRAPAPDLIGRLLWPHVDALYETDATIHNGLIETAASYCARLLEIDGPYPQKRSGSLLAG